MELNPNNIFCRDKIFYHFKDQYLRGNYNNWSEFIDYLNIGLGYVDGAYILKNKKQWLLAKLKYGI